MITSDMELPVLLGRILLIIAFFTVTSFPVLYAFSPWYKRPLGRAVMMQAMTLALAIWLKFFLTFFLVNGPRTFLLWTNVVVLALIITATSSLTYQLWVIRRTAKRKAIEDEQLIYFDRSAIE